MEQSIEAIEAKIESLKEHASTYRRLAAEHSAADNPLIADAMTKAAAECDAKAAKLERLLTEQVRGGSHLAAQIRYTRGARSS